MSENESRIESSASQASSGSIKPGDIWYDAWGYDQTQNDFIQILQVSPTGKTVTARRIGARQVDSYNVKADPTVFKEETFRLHIRKGSDYGPYLVGSYPFVWGMPEAKRRGVFGRYTGPVYETPAGMGH